MTNYPEKTGTFNGSDGVQIFYRHYAADSERARMVIAHGLGEHSGRYGNVVERLLHGGFSVWIPDHRGHGQSGGPRGHVLNFVQYLADLRSMVELACQDRRGSGKCFLMGHSLGGLIALNFAQRYPELLNGVLVSSPALGMAIKVPTAKRILACVLSWLWPGLTMNNELDATHISHDQAVVRAYADDPLVHERVSARFFTEFTAAMEAVNLQAASIRNPILMQVAGNDHLVNAKATEQFFEKLTAPDRTLHVYEGLYHEIYNEAPDQRDRVLKDLEDWLAQRV